MARSFSTSDHRLAVDMGASHLRTRRRRQLLLGSLTLGGLAALLLGQQVGADSEVAWVNVAATPVSVGPRDVAASRPTRAARLLARAAGEGSSDKEAALATLADSAMIRETSPEKVFDAIRLLEKQKDMEGVSGFEQQLTGDWRLIYTTGTKKTEDEVGRVNYVPITAVQRFDMQKKFIRNGVYFGPLSLEFEGSLRWIEERRRLEFDFEDLKVCGMSVPLPDFMRGAAGMKSSTPYKRQPAFDFVAADGRIIAARGAGGGVALWLRNDLAN